jgi:hypothetical protein
MPIEKIRLRGASTRAMSLVTGAAPREVTIVFAEGEDLPVGTLYATATSRGEVVELVPYDLTGSDGIVTVQVTVDPEDFAAYGSRTWALEVGTLDDGSGDDDTAYVMFSGWVSYREESPNVIASTTIEEAGSS